MNLDAAAKKAARTVRQLLQLALIPLISPWMMKELTLLLAVAIRVVETPYLRNKGAQVSIGWVVLPSGPVGGPIEFGTQGTHAGVSICVNDTTTAHDAGCAFGGCVLMGVSMRLGLDGGKQGGESKKD